LGIIDNVFSCLSVALAESDSYLQAKSGTD